MARVVVIGAGIAGLASAARLARLRHDVLVVERSDGPGGSVGRFERDGFAFDTGPTVVHMPAGFRDLFIKSGKTQPLESVLELRPTEPSLRWQFPDGIRIDLPNASKAGTGDVGAALGREAARQWDAFVDEGNAVWAEFRKGFLAAPEPVRTGLFRGKADRGRAAALSPAKSYRHLMQRHLKHPHLHTAADSYVRRLGADPATAPAGMVLWPWLEQTFGTWEVVGGVRVLVDAVADRVRRRGGDIRYGAEVTAVRPGFTVALASGETLEADLVVAAVDDLALRNLAPAALPTAAAPRSLTLRTTLLAVEGEDDGPLLTVLPVGPLHVSRAHAPAGRTGWSVVAPAGTDVVRTLDAHGWGLADRLLWKEELPESDPVCGPAMTDLLRPPNTTAVPNLWHVGASTHPGPGLALSPLVSSLLADAVGRAK